MQRQPHAAPARVLKSEDAEPASFSLAEFRPGNYGTQIAPLTYDGSRSTVVQTPRLHRVLPSAFASSGAAVSLAFSLEGARSFEDLVLAVEARALDSGSRHRSKRFVSRVAPSDSHASLLRVMVPEPSKCVVYDAERQRVNFEQFMVAIQGYVDVQALIDFHHAWVKGGDWGITLHVKALQFFPRQQSGGDEADLGEAYPFLE
jgi:hypothetical protein